MIAEGKGDKHVPTYAELRTFFKKRGQKIMKCQAQHA